jgi:hypothetical protein
MVCIKIGFWRVASLGFCREDGQNVNTYSNQFQNLHFHSPKENRYSWAIKWNSTSPQLGFLESLQWVRTSEVRFLGSIHPSMAFLVSSHGGLNSVEQNLRYLDLEFLGFRI